FAQHSEGDFTSSQLVQLVGQHFGGQLGDRRTEADLRQTALHRGLAAFEAGLDLATALAGERTLVAATGSLAQARTDTTTDAGTLGTSARSRAEVIETQSHDLLLLNLDQVGHLVDQTANLRAVLQGTNRVQLVQAQSLHRQAVTLLGATQTTDQTDGDGLDVVISHGSDPPPSCRAWQQCGPATGLRTGPSGLHGPG